MKGEEAAPEARGSGSSAGVRRHVVEDLTAGRCGSKRHRRKRGRDRSLAMTN